MTVIDEVISLAAVGVSPDEMPKELAHRYSAPTVKDAVGYLRQHGVLPPRVTLRAKVQALLEQDVPSHRIANLLALEHSRDAVRSCVARVLVLPKAGGGG